jgi:predicted CXXCH cytochrome family protein
MIEIRPAVQMKKISRIGRLSLIRWLALLGLIVVLSLITGGSSHAQPPPDLACRGCHGDNQRELTLPSGETLPLLVPLDLLDQSAHSVSSHSGISCSDCHSNDTNYRFPHEPPTETDRRAYTLAASQSCESCHYAHNPFHGDLDPATNLSGMEMPTCVDCHTAHEVEPFERMVNVMPERCMACHTDEPAGWAAYFFDNRVGFGEGAVGFSGSRRCLGCHEDVYLSWRDTLHAGTIQDARVNPDAIVADFTTDDPQRTIELTDVAYTIGGDWMQRFITVTSGMSTADVSTTVDITTTMGVTATADITEAMPISTFEGGFYVLPAEWHSETQAWASYHPDTWNETDWRESCGTCHITGLNTESWEFTEFGIGCESCHGPAEDHVADPENVKPFAAIDDQVCGACHSRGTSPDGFAFPATFRPGDQLTDHFAFTTDPADSWPDGSAKLHNQQYLDWTLGNSMEADDATSCASCHVVHGGGVGRAQLKAPANELCVECHSDKRALINHMPYHEVASAEHEFTCTDCHMPKMAISAVAYDIHSHTFLQPNPQGSIDHGGVEAMPNSCNLCHTDLGETSEWAVEIIDYSVAQQEGDTSFFAPGPTPTAPPTPTPLPSVGQPVDVYVRPPGLWLRYGFFALFGLLGLGISVYLVVRIVRSRRSVNV